MKYGRQEIILLFWEFLRHKLVRVAKTVIADTVTEPAGTHLWAVVGGLALLSYRVCMS